MNDAIWGLIPAAGAGARMLANQPKQYLPLADTCVLDVTLNLLLQLPNLAGLVVALSAGDDLFASLARASHPLVVPVVGGQQRAESVLRGLQHLESALDAKEADWVLVHDAARPCVQLASIQRLIDSVLAQNCGGILAVPVADTLKQVQDGQIAATLDRSHLWQAQTPQMFRMAELRQALQIGLAEGLSITDEASAMELQGYTPLVVMDRRDNIKITHPEDLWLAGQILRRHAGET